MREATIKLTIDSAPRDDVSRLKLIELYRFVVDQAVRLEIDEYVRITWELDGGGEPSEREESESSPGAIRALSRRQRQIATMLCDHYSIKRIAGELFVSVNTVKKHIQNMKRALEVETSGADFIYELNRLRQGGRLTENGFAPFE
ncbi:response regulator transcription factor [Paenibacillaceae bacterium WGS1546]|uniref:response regulator transcription factor n=1 Tax=Cohnella sp. WGS1546 TaxID=3366810 RepID=UPI00372CE9C9